MTKKTLHLALLVANPNPNPNTNPNLAIQLFHEFSSDFKISDFTKSLISQIYCNIYTLKTLQL